jgi:hypothetical protein
MTEVINKELISHLLKLEADQQDQVLRYVKDMLTTAEMQRRADASEMDIKAGRVKDFEQFSTDFENWKKQRRQHTR